MMVQRIWRFVVFLVALALLLVACNGGGEQAEPTDGPTDERIDETPRETPADTPEELEQVRIQFDWIADSQYTPTLLAMERGYFAEEGLEPIIAEGGGTVSAAQVLGAGRADIVVGTLDQVPLAVAQGIDLTAVAIIEPVSSSAIIVLADSEINEPTDLEGKTVGTLAGAASGVLLEPFLRAVNVDPATVETANVPFPSQVPLLIEGQFDAITGFTRAQGAIAQVAGAETRHFRYADHGINFVSTGIYTRTEVIAERPDMVRGVVRAILRGLADMIEDPAAAVEVGAREYPQHYENRDYADLHGELFAQFVEEQSSPQGLGYMEAEWWERTVELLQDFFDLEDPLLPEEYYTNEFIPDLE
jgi:NitT/TauT family transport system substrate-binding protein